MSYRILVTAAAFAALLISAAAPAGAAVEVRRVYAQGDQLVLEVVDRPEAASEVEVEIDGRTYSVPVPTLRPNQSRTLRTSIELPCGSSTRVEARVGSSSKSENLRVPCSAASSGGSGSDSPSNSGSPGSAPAGRSTSDLVEIGDLAVNPRQGQLQAQVEIRAYPPRRQPVEVLFEYAGFSEKVQERRFSLNNARTVSTRQPFPCNEAQRVTATVVGPPEWAGVSTTANLTRRCSRSQGTPNLVPLSLERDERGESTAIGQTSIRVRVQVENAADFDMPDNEQGGNMWIVRVSGLNRPQQVRRALKGGEKFSFTERITQPCWSVERDRFGEVTVTVDDRNTILESNENDNQKTFTIERKRCRDAG